MHSRWLKKPQSPRTPKKFGNNRYLNTPNKLKKLKSLQARAAFLQRETHLLAGKVSTSAVPVDAALTHLLHKMEEGSESIAKSFPEGSFKRLFWDQQLLAACLSDARQMRWHPVIIRWCLNLKMLSSAAYHAMRTSDFISLPDSSCHKTVNPYSSSGRFLYYISDPPHLLKTTRNCWSHSGSHGNRRKLWVSTSDRLALSNMFIYYLHDCIYMYN